MTEVSEGQQVRKAYDGPKVEHDALISELEARIREEHARSSDASESSAKMKKFLDETELNSQAVSWGKTILKKLPKKDGQTKAMDVIRSLKEILPMIENHVAGQGTGEMDLEGPQEDTETDEEPIEEPQPEVQDEETEDFNNAVDANMGDDVVTPIDFLPGGDAA
ncbi:hypothetical protein [Ruegeria lacuscaerulensis]|uniref:hypothetical protein n=1 Tax=Ruegeria lacuscaerulensis TaxID=55218 RepID=UPI00147B967F|nr:hypothetical protein [Ruegeria lacuscaerulensis]